MECINNAYNLCKQIEGLQCKINKLNNQIGICKNGKKRIITLVLDTILLLGFLAGYVYIVIQILPYYEPGIGNIFSNIFRIGDFLIYMVIYAIIFILAYIFCIAILYGIISLICKIPNHKRTAKIEEYNNDIMVLNNSINNIRNKLTTSGIPNKYLDVNILSNFIEIYNSNRADTLRDIINIFENDKMLQKQNDILAERNELLRQQNNKIDQQTRKIKDLQSDVKNISIKNSFFKYIFFWTI